MICMNSFGASNNYPHVWLVIYAGTLKQMIGFNQEVGSGGQDRKPAKCIIVPHENAKAGEYKEVPEDGLDHCGYAAVWTIIYPSKDCL